MTTFTKPEMDLLTSMLGLKSERPGYRNRFCASKKPATGTALQTLMANGYIYKSGDAGRDTAMYHAYAHTLDMLNMTPAQIADALDF